MSCIKKEILIGGKGREDHYVRLEKREKGEYKKHPTWKPSWSDAQDFMSNTNY